MWRISGTTYKRSVYWRKERVCRERNECGENVMKEGRECSKGKREYLRMLFVGKGKVRVGYMP